MALDGVKNIVLVLSGKGGVGKSSVTLQLALALTLQGRSVGILDVDLTGPSIPRLVGKEDAKITQGSGGWTPVLVHPAFAASSSNSSVPSPPPQSSTSAATGTGGPTGTGTDKRTTTITTTTTTTTSQPSVTLPDTNTDPDPDTDTQPNTQPQLQNDQKRPTDTAPRGSLRCMSLGFLLRDRGDAVIWRGPKKTAMIRQFLTDVLWGETDYLLVDTPPGTSDEHIALAEQLLTLATTTRIGTATSHDATSAQQQQQEQQQQQQQQRKKPLLAGAVLVTTPQAISTADVRKELNFCAKTCIPVIGVVENMSGYSCPCCGEVSNVFSSGGGRVMAEEMGVRFLGAVPIDVGFGEMVEGVRGNREAVVDGSEGEEFLVERYQKCWSRPLFEGFARTVIEEAEGHR
ncbi:cytosolic Fe-S cluster assembling factor [Histoplasma capsulatum G186AR]|uniref:Cytosolic Fe-S cluster assembling factor n=1 Tax=Ajellomyces capsulatus (strain G186AR / H82 / ATCC MYA-2454 / RMSCC 2432) TaxID=447093 RepID=C0NTP4_AJECG|nr:cytosolic Fe-S cluster assembling factor [Histoplasma capsulatum G186AR]EEH05405.1 cytosolic Fe-S cluster assembling factor [Histoplasma capsulatum G186AR]